MVRNTKDASNRSDGEAGKGSTAPGENKEEPSSAGLPSKHTATVPSSGSNKGSPPSALHPAAWSIDLSPSLGTHSTDTAGISTPC